ncbi:MAG: monovalent cation/H+ antiporter complex subunit F [Sandaracinaceae bacterium]|nr:monovalent cation/H+ antiporter complex subunit F [Sandaracinaceae bacterium]
MSPEPSDVLSLAVTVSWAVLLVGAALLLYRVVRGPHTADRVVALDLVSYFAVGMCALHALHEREEYPLHPAMALALLAFLGTIVFVVYSRLGRRR